MSVISSSREASITDEQAASTARTIEQFNAKCLVVERRVCIVAGAVFLLAGEALLLSGKNMSPLLKSTVIACVALSGISLLYIAGRFFTNRNTPTATPHQAADRV